VHVEDTAGRPPRRAHAEDAGFDIFQVGDHVGAEPSALICLAAAAVATERIRLGTLVLNNGLHHPVPLAQEVATLDQLSNGRLEVGLGAGHSFTEYAAMVNPSTHQRNARSDWPSRSRSSARCSTVPRCHAAAPTTASTRP
jgi:alkanesulfonate monooxygenase SsuD/methylene tetrahydromethanopterin reductase-like flavin-dependent oxidoreductase (luciferase family)